MYLPSTTQFVLELNNSVFGPNPEPCQYFRVVFSFSKDRRLLIFSWVHGGGKVRNPAKCSKFQKAFENYTSVLILHLPCGVSNGRSRWRSFLPNCFVSFTWSILTRFLEMHVISVAHMYVFSLKVHCSVVESFHHAIVIPGIIFSLW